MKTLRALGKRLLFPPLALVPPLIVLAAGLLIHVFAGGLDGTPLAYAVYTFSAYALLIACTSVPAALAMGRRIRQNEQIGRFLSDYAFRTRMALRLGLLLNLAFAVFKFAAGCLYASYWLSALGFYYAVLALMRFFLLRRIRRSDAQPGAFDPIAPYRAYRLTGAMMFVLNAVMSVIIFQVIRDNRTYSYPGSFIYAFGAYAFYKITMAVVNLVRRRRQDDPLLSAARHLNLAVAMMSVFSLQTALLSAFGGEDGAFRLLINAASGAVICAGILFIAVMMVIRGNRAIRALQIHNF